MLATENIEKKIRMFSFVEYLFNIRTINTKQEYRKKTDKNLANNSTHY